MVTKSIIDNIIDAKENFIEWPDSPSDILFGFIAILIFILLIPLALLIDIVFIIPEIIACIVYWWLS